MYQRPPSVFTRTGGFLLHLTPLRLKVRIWDFQSHDARFDSGRGDQGRCGELVKPADCKSVTRVVNIAGSSPARPTSIIGAIGRRSRLKICPRKGYGFESHMMYQGPKLTRWKRLPEEQEGLVRHQQVPPYVRVAEWHMH